MDKCATIIVPTEGTKSLMKERKRRLKLSLNSNYDKLPIKAKEPAGQASIVSFFQKKNPVEAALNSNKHSSICGSGTELKGKKKKKHKKTNENNAVCNHENKLASDAEMEADRKVRFSEQIVEISPEPVKKLQFPDLNNESSGKINAFSFMMENRHKSIGQNCSGIEVEHVEESTELKSEQKKKLLTRKVLFEEWSECKGSKKRKVEYVEQGLVIEEKLNKRAKRLKKMLNINKKQNNTKKLSLNKHREANGECDTGSPHKWKMKLKVSLDAERVDKISTKKVDVKSTKDRGKQKAKEEADEIKVMKDRKRAGIIDSSSDSDSVEVLPLNEREKPRKTVGEKKQNGDIRIAPLFFAAKGKSKVDKAAVEARKQFLHSTLPDSVKKVIEKQPKLEIADYEVFPTVSHIKVKADDSDVSKMINMSSVNLCLTASDSELPKIGQLTKGCVTNLNETSSEGVDLMNGKKTKSFKSILKVLKRENPDYPIYRTFKSLYNKSNVHRLPNCESPKKLKKGRSKKKKNDPVKLKKSPQMWTEMYRPVTSEEMMGNRPAVDKLKTWLQSWMETNLTERISERRGSNSSSDFEDGDEDSRNASSLLENTVILVGPHGSGKTAAVYAVCNEAGVNILEINASSKRTGKKLLLDLHEATQSYQVRKQAALSTYIKSNLMSDDSGKLGKMCLLLIEDVDLVFEQDDGFLAALSQLVVTSKRPIVLTTTDMSCSHVKKFSTVIFPAMSPRFLTPWLQLLCLVEGTFVSQDSVVKVLENYRGDVRKTILHLQFWVESGGDENTERIPRLNNTEEILGEDDSSSLSWLNVDGEDLDRVPVQHVQFLEDQSLVDFGSVWWNTHNILEIPPPSRSIERKLFEEVADNRKYDLTNICNYFETLTLTDIVYKKFNLNDDFESVSKITYKIGGDSLELNESEEPYTSRDICCEWIKALCNAQFTNTKISQAKCSPAEKMWRKKFSTYNEDLLEVVPQVNQLQGDAISLDYLSTLRTMSRSEIVRAGNNNKRRSRFYNYLRGLGLHCNFQVISNVFYLEK